MCKIINFPTTNSNSYINLVNFFEASQSVNTCEFYLGVVEHADLTERERYGLRCIGRQKLKKLQDAAQPKPSTPGVYIYHPEMSEACPDCQISARHDYYGNHYYIDTALTLKGRGIRFIDSKNGLNRYQVTNRAYDLLKEQYTISMECLLD